MAEWFEEAHEWDESPEKKTEFENVFQVFQGRLDQRRDWVRAPCPFCVELDGKEDYKASLGYNHHTGRYKCFKCGVWGYLPINFRVELSDDAEDALLRPAPPRERVPLQPASGYAPLWEEPGLSSRSLDWARYYLLQQRKGLTQEALTHARVGAALWGPLSQRVIVPFPDYSDPTGSWKGWVARATYGGSSVLPYKYAKGFERKGYLYGEPALYVDTRDPVYITEGAFDALSLWPDGVAVLGKPLESHNEAFRRAKRPIAVVLDGDIPAEGQALAWTLQHYGKMATYVRLPPKADPDELGKAAVRALYDRALAESNT